MTPSVWSWLAIAAGLAVTALAAAGEGALSAGDQPRERRDDAARRLTGEPLRAWVTIWILGALAPALTAVGALPVVWVVAGARGALLASVLAVLLLVTLLACRLLPLTWAARRPEAVGRYLVVPLDLAARLLWPVRALFRAVRRLTGGSRPDVGSARDDALRALAHVDAENGTIEDEEMEMITGIIELGDTKVREVMVPRIDIVAIPSDASLEDSLETIIHAGHSRIPVYTESLDHIDGLLYAKDLLKAYLKRDFMPDMRKFLREPYYVPESKPVDELLEELQTRKVHMAVVVDEYGGTAGLVTIEDLIEEIVGEIQDEYDDEEPRIERVSDDEAVFNAGIDIDDVNRLLSIHLPTDHVDTLGGLVFTGLGKVPVPGERAVFDDAEIEVLEVDGRRINRVRVVRRARDENGQPIEGEATSARPPDGADGRDA